MQHERITVTAAEANRSFSKLLRAVREGKTITITSHGQPIAQIGPSKEAEERKRRTEAFERLQAHWATLEPEVIGPWTREELYERDRGA